jgi:hypothetical protein
MENWDLVLLNLSHGYPGRGSVIVQRDAAEMLRLRLEFLDVRECDEMFFCARNGVCSAPI